MTLTAWSGRGGDFVVSINYWPHMAWHLWACFLIWQMGVSCSSILGYTLSLHTRLVKTRGWMSIHISKVFRKGPLGAKKRNLKERGWRLLVACWTRLIMIFPHLFLPIWGVLPILGPPAQTAFLWTTLHSKLLAPLWATSLAYVWSPFLVLQPFHPSESLSHPIFVCTFQPAKWGLQFVSEVCVRQNEFKLPKGPECSPWIPRADESWKEGAYMLKKPRKAS